MRTQKQIENCLKSELGNLKDEFKLGRLTEADLYSYFSSMLIDAGVDSQIIVNVLEDQRFGELGKEEALCIKINEGW